MQKGGALTRRRIVLALSLALPLWFSSRIKVVGAHDTQMRTEGKEKRKETRILFVIGWNEPEMSLHVPRSLFKTSQSGVGTAFERRPQRSTWTSSEAPGAVK